MAKGGNSPILYLGLESSDNRMRRRSRRRWRGLLDVPATRGSRLSLKVAFVGALSALTAVLALLVIAQWQSRKYETLAGREIDTLLSNELDRITLSAYALVRTEDRAVNQEVEGALNVTRRLFRESGARVDPQPDAKTQATLMRVVEEATALIGAAATVFRRTNEAGDMVRVATTVRDASGRPAVGTYIRALTPDGRPDPVAGTILRGESYRGRAFVVDNWYIAAYEPIRDDSGRISGMLFAGIPQAKAEALIRDAIITTRVGRSGYIYVFSGKGPSRGHYIVSQDGTRDGEYIWDERDPDGRYIVRDIVETALSRPSGELSSIRYLWKNPTDALFRSKRAVVTYYERWDWVIGASIYDDELESYLAVISSGRERMTAAMAIAGAMIAALVGTAAWAIAFHLSSPLRRIAAAAGEVARGLSPAFVEARSRDEIGELASAFNFMSRRVEGSLATLRASEEKYRGIFENAAEGIMVATLDGKALAANPAQTRMLGYASSEELTRALSDLRSSLYVDGHDRDAIIAELKGSGRALGREVKFRRKDGTMFWVSINAHIAPDDEGQMTRVIGFTSDIDRRKRADEALRDTLREKDILLKEIHHRVKNNLQVIASLVAMQRRTVSDRESLSLYEDFANRVLAMSQVHELIYDSGDFSRIDFSAYARALAENLRQSCLSTPDEVELAFNDEPIELGLDQAMPCGLFLNEILSNSFRHAFPKPRKAKGHILVTLASGPGGKVELSVSDDGIGMPELPTPDDPRHMGLALIDLLAAQLGGELERRGGPGTSYRLRFVRTTTIISPSAS
jgi:PAS domain S-box-containing protein